MRALVIALLLAVVPHAKAQKVHSGHDLYKLCEAAMEFVAGQIRDFDEARDTLQEGLNTMQAASKGVQCFTYLQAVADTALAVDATLTTRGRERSKTTCPPEEGGISNQERLMAFMYWAENHPESLEAPPVFPVMWAYQWRWPCK